MIRVALYGMTKRFASGAIPAVDDLTLNVQEGEILALLGPSGSGKTTILRLIAGFEIPDEGRIEIGGQVVTEAAFCAPPERRGVGMVFQDYALFPHLTVLENVAFGLRIEPREKRRERAQEVLEHVGLGDLGDRYPHELSGGQQQRVALGRALAPRPQVILLDEPFSDLDADLRARMRQDIQGVLRRTQTTAIFVTHDQEEAFEIADRVGVLNQGRLEQVDTPEVIYHLPTTRFAARFVGSADFLPGEVTASWIVTELGLFPLPKGTPAAGEVDVMIRPDDILLSADSRGPGVPGHIVRRQFRGSENLYTVRLPSGQIVHSSQGSTTIFEDGLSIRVTAVPTHVVTFPRKTPAGNERETAVRRPREERDPGSEEQRPARPDRGDREGEGDVH